jgi:DNA polymerase III subunit chi
VRVDFYQLGEVPLEQVIASLAQKLLDSGERLLIIAAEEPFLARLDRVLWDLGRTSFLPHGIAGEGDDSRQPILLSTSPDPANGARNLLIADGEWRDSALAFHRAFYLFDANTLDGARAAWRSLAGRDGAERHFWKREQGKWAEQELAASRARG